MLLHRLALRLGCCYLLLIGAAVSVAITCAILIFVFLFVSIGLVVFGWWTEVLRLRRSVGAAVLVLESAVDDSREWLLVPWRPHQDVVFLKGRRN